MDASEQLFDELPVYTIPSHHPPQMDVLPNTFLQNIRAAKWQVRHSATAFALSSLLILLLQYVYIQPSELKKKLLIQGESRQGWCFCKEM